MVVEEGFFVFQGSGGETGEVMPIETDDKLSRLRVELGEVMPIETDDKLSRLLEQCTKLQDRIDETLSIYF